MRLNVLGAGVVGYPDGMPAQAAQLVVRAQTDFAYNQYPLTYKWGPIANAGALGGSYAIEDGTDASQTFTFTGTSLGVVLWAGPGNGKAKIKVTNSGLSTQTVDTYAATAGDRTVSFPSLPAGTHKVTTTLTGTKNSASTGYAVGVDGFIVNAVTNATPTTNATLSDGPNYGYVYSRYKGATITMTKAWGSGFAWNVVVGPNAGQAKVYIDGALAATEDLYAPSYSNPSYTFNLGATGLHSIRIVLTGTKQAASTDTVVRSRGITVL
jgi:trimeric autotransporter adhesin